MLGFVGSPWTLATYLIEGGSTPLYKKIKTMTQVSRAPGLCGFRVLCLREAGAPQRTQYSNNATMVTTYENESQQAATAEISLPVY